MVGRIEESQENREIMRRHEAHDSVSMQNQCWRKTNTNTTHQQLLQSVTMIGYS